MTDTDRWLWVTAELPAQLSTGRLVYSGRLAEAVADEGVAVTMVGLGSEPQAHPGITWRSVGTELRGGRRSLLSPLPNLAYACAVPEARAAIGELLDSPWDAVVIDHLQAAWAMPLVEERHRGITAFVTHNHEATVRRAVASAARLWNGRRLVLSYDAAKAARLERSTARSADVVTAITANDRRLFETDAPRSRHIVLAPGWSGDAPATLRPMSSRPRRAAILGSFDWHVKQENLRRFLPVADPILRAAGVELVIGGRIPNELSEELVPGLAATRFVGWVDSTTEFLADCRIGIVAEPLGGGFKMKSLDYVFNGVAVASLAGSIAGIPLAAGESLIEAERAGSLAHAIVDIIDDTHELERITTNALRACEAEFTWKHQARRLIDAVG